MEHTKVVQDSDNVLAISIKQGNQLAFATVFDRYNKQLYALAYRYLKSRDMAEDAVQQIFINLWTNRSRINPDLSIKSFLFTSLKNHTLNVLRDYNKSIEKNYEALMEAAFTADNERYEEERLEMTTLIEKAVEKLSPQRRQIYYLKIMDGCSNQEIANKLNISVNTVKVQYYHILKELKEFVGKSMTSSILLVSCIFNP